MVHEGRHKQRDPHVSLSSAKSFSRDRSSKGKASSSRQSERGKGHGPKGRHIKPPIGEWPKGTYGKGNKEKLGIAEKAQIMATLTAVLKQEGPKFDCATKGLIALIQKCEEGGKLQRLKSLNDDPDCI